MASSNESNLPLTGKVFAITGGASGIGLATAKTLSKRGAAVAIADVDPEAMKTAEEHFSKLHVPFTISKVDVSKRSDVDSWIGSTVDMFGRLDGAANVAGIIGKHHGITSVAELEDDEWDKIIAINLTGMMYCLRAELQKVVDGGSIVNVSSIHGLKGFPKHAAYDASKHGVIGLTRAAALENGAREVRVNSVAPGAIYTPLMQKNWDARGRAADAPFEDPSAFQRQGTAEETANDGRQANWSPSAVITASENHGPIWKDPGFRKLLFPVIIVYLTQEWKREMGSPNSSQLGLVSAIYFIGSGQFFTIIGAGFQAGYHARAQYMGSRLILGFGVTFVACAGSALLGELAIPRFRGTLVSFFNPFWYLGSIIVAWTRFGTSHMSAFDTWSWQIPSLLQALIPCCVLPCIYWIPKSPRWLVSQGRTEEAKAIFVKYHGNCDENDPLVATQVAGIQLAMEQAKEGISRKALLTQANNLHRLSIVVCMTLMTLWCGRNIITYYFSTILASIGVTGTTQQTGINGGLNILNFLSSVIGASLVDRTGRRKLWMISYIGMIVIFVPYIALNAVYAKEGRSGEGYGVIVCLFLFDFMYNVACNPLLYSYPTEIMPFFMRSKGLAVKTFVGQTALIINMYVNPIALAAISYYYYVFFLALNCLWLFLIWMYFPETNGYSLEELSTLFDGNGDNVQVLDGKVVTIKGDNIVEETEVDKKEL
ncbi:putative General substrate transporter [Seiridium cardinale]